MTVPVRPAPDRQHNRPAAARRRLVPGRSGCLALQRVNSRTELADHRIKQTANAEPAAKRHVDRRVAFTVETAFPPCLHRRLALDAEFGRAPGQVFAAGRIGERQIVVDVQLRIQLRQFGGRRRQSIIDHAAGTLVHIGRHPVQHPLQDRFKRLGFIHGASPPPEMFRTSIRP